MLRADSRIGRLKAARGTKPLEPIQRVLIVEPEELTRWSLVTYLRRWFDVCSAQTSEVANKILDDRRIDAVVVSDDLPGRSARKIETHARSRNPAARVIRTVTKPIAVAKDAYAFRLEKPFNLADIAELFGVSDPGVNDSNTHSDDASSHKKPIS